MIYDYDRLQRYLSTRTYTDDKIDLMIIIIVNRILIANYNLPLDSVLIIRIFKMSVEGRRGKHLALGPPYSPGLSIIIS